MKPIKIYAYLGCCTLVGLLAIVLLFQASENIMHKRNTFIRRFDPGTIKAEQKDLRYNSFYLAGIDDGVIYLGNGAAPQVVTIMDTVLNNLSEGSIELEAGGLPYLTAQLRVTGGIFYLIDGVRSTISSGPVSNWRAQEIWKGRARFSQPYVLDGQSIACRIINPGTKEVELARIDLASPEVKISPAILERQVDGVFDVDGLLQYDPTLKQLGYVYYYRNQYIIADNDLRLKARGTTIDTTTQAKIKIASVHKGQEKKFSAPPLVVNKLMALHKNLLFVNSQLIGRYEDDGMWKQASIVDAYDTDSKTYLSSFYVYDVDGIKMRGFFVSEGYLYAFVGQYLVRYRLSDTITAAYRKNKTY